jgi:hypothetical protein
VTEEVNHFAKIEVDSLQSQLTSTLGSVEKLKEERARHTKELARWRKADKERKEEESRMQMGSSFQMQQQVQLVQQQQQQLQQQQSGVKRRRDGSNGGVSSEKDHKYANTTQHPVATQQQQPPPPLTGAISPTPGGPLTRNTSSVSDTAPVTSQASSGGSQISFSNAAGEGRQVPSLSVPIRKFIELLSYGSEAVAAAMGSSSASSLQDDSNTEATTTANISEISSPAKKKKMTKKNSHQPTLTPQSPIKPAGGIATSSQPSSSKSSAMVPREPISQLPLSLLSHLLTTLSYTTTSGVPTMLALQPPAVARFPVESTLATLCTFLDTFSAVEEQPGVTGLVSRTLALFLPRVLDLAADSSGLAEFNGSLGAALAKLDCVDAGVQPVLLQWHRCVAAKLGGGVAQAKGLMDLIDPKHGRVLAEGLRDGNLEKKCEILCYVVAQRETLGKEVVGGVVGCLGDCLRDTLEGIPPKELVGIFDGKDGRQHDVSLHLSRTILYQSMWLLAQAGGDTGVMIDGDVAGEILNSVELIISACCEEVEEEFMGLLEKVEEMLNNFRSAM